MQPTAWIREIPDHEAEALLKEHYDAAILRAGRVFNIVRVMSVNPTVMRDSMNPARSPYHRAPFRPAVCISPDESGTGRLTMYCIVCSHDVVDCECRDIEQRLASLCRPECGVAPAAATNLEARTLKKLTSGKPPN